MLAFRAAVFVNRMGFWRWLVDYVVAYVGFDAALGWAWEERLLGWDGARVNFRREILFVLAVLVVFVVFPVFVVDWVADRLSGGRSWRDRLRLLWSTTASVFVSIPLLLPIWLFTEVEAPRTLLTLAEFFQELARRTGGAAVGGAGVVVWMLSRVKRAPGAALEGEGATGGP